MVGQNEKFMLELTRYVYNMQQLWTNTSLNKQSHNVAKKEYNSTDQFQKHMTEHPKNIQQSLTLN
jgi:hypothetical protein